ncbi:MAG: preprotein translocase SecA subunit, partial [candidate division NC10 bacterium]|nr:preprotein translocase SecA subunit [candidate division NC10 bacterium]
RARRVVLRGLHYAIVDEADSVLVDEARTPLIISGRHADEPERQIYEMALNLAGRLESGRDFVVDQRERSIRITDAGQAHLDELASGLDGVWTGPRRREEFVRQALTALFLYTRDVHYLVCDDKVQIVDEYTGRVMADRSWERGLHQLIETKERCAVTGRQQTLARISYQRFFRRYLKLAGMTGTAREVAGELWAVYRLATVPIPTNRPLHRRAARGRFFVTQEAKWKAIVDRIVSLHGRGRPVLVGTRSVAASERLSALLTQAEIPHRVLNARQDKEEADIVAKAGEAGQVTVATNMAGRGTDIRLGPGVAQLGGLHVIATERHEAARIDRQLFGRCGRQGDPGTYEAIVSLQDEIVKVHGGILWWLALGMATVLRRVPRWAGRLAFFWAQRGSQRLYSRARRDLLEHDEHLDRMLAFSGLVE